MLALLWRVHAPNNSLILRRRYLKGFAHKALRYAT